MTHPRALSFFAEQITRCSRGRNEQEVKLVPAYDFRGHNVRVELTRNPDIFWEGPVEQYRQALVDAISRYPDASATEVPE